ncbi:MAG: hypothetical protein HY423_13440 [Candidatus Lambdaproteobacteria bacterium]|nr:hypothetical protein [Candidatus Lambdaproteobacteria bacterium]
MSISGYQVEWLIRRLRRLRGGEPWSRQRRQTAAYRMELSARAEWYAEGYAYPEPSQPPSAPRLRPAAVADLRPYPLRVAQELERRAGLFMQPPFEPEPAPLPVPKVRRPHRAAVKPRIVLES